ncbi:hypothetical protein Taro_008345, partial [Colocasia esculenta]|nr:hypothetical protein [Colocasia esculenta]
LSSATSLFLLYLYSNNLSGMFPSSLCSLPQLQNLDISRNALSGTIPTELGGCHQLQRLVVSSNQAAEPHTAGPLIQWLHREIPNVHGHLPTTVRYDLRHNNLSGQIPQVGALSNQGATAFLGNAKLCGSLWRPRRRGGLTKGLRLEVIILIALADAAGVAVVVLVVYKVVLGSRVSVAVRWLGEGGP